MAAPVVWFEVKGQDTAKLQHFYQQLFAWEITDTPTEMQYGLVAQVEGGIPGGIGKAQTGPGKVTFYVQVPDIVATLAEAEMAGGSTLLPRTVMGDTILAMFSDPEGHVIGLVEG